MRIFEAARTNLKAIGIEPNRVAFGPHEAKHILAYITSIMLQFVYLVYVAKTPREYMKSIYMIAAGIFIMITYLSFKFNSRKIFKLVDDFQQTIEKSE